MRKFFSEDTSRTTRAALFLGLGMAVASLTILGALLWSIPFRLGAVEEALHWFDKWFVQYNLTLIIFSILIVPFLTLVYVGSRRYEKVRRLRRELCERRESGKPPVWGDSVAACNHRVEIFVHDQFQLRAYLPSMVAMMVTVALGVSILLLAKPVFEPGKTNVATGINYANGANMLLLGPNAKFYMAPDSDMFKQVLTSLCAFQYGFLGAFIYAITSLIWSYFNVDLTPHSLVAGTVRMVTASVLALVLSFILPEKGLPAIAFFLGYFPNRALLVLERFGRQVLSVTTEYAATPLHSLPGLGLNDEWRLTYEGLDSLEHMETADPLDLAIRTGYSYTQLCTWCDQAWLATRMRGDYETWIAKTGILGRDALRDYFSGEADRIDDAIAKMSAATGVPEVKLRALYVLLCRKSEEHACRELSPDPKLSASSAGDHVLPAVSG